MSTGFFVGDLREGTRVKLTLLRKFIVPWSTKLSLWAQKAQSSVIWYVDLFAGEGMIGLRDAGSPLIAAERSAEMALKPNTPRLGIFAVEMQQHRFNALKSRLASFRERGIPIETRQGQWSRFVKEILETTAGSPILLFVDPFGLKGVGFQDLRPLLTRRHPVDVIVRLHDPAVFRNRELYPQMITAASGTADWLDAWRVAPNDPISWVRKCYALSIKSALQTDLDVVAYGVRLKYGRNPRFSILFGSRHPDALDLWNENLGDHELDLRQKMATTDSGQSTFLPGVYAEEREQEVTGFVEMALKDATHLSGREVIATIRRDQQQIVKATEVHSALRRLAHRGALNVSTLGRRYLDIVFWIKQRSFFD